MTELTLEGCNCEPLSSYLSAFAILRLVCEQKDADALGWWKNGVFHLESSLDKEKLVAFFLEEYIPTPIVSPWGGGSGFSEGDNTEGLDAIMESDSDRFATYQKAIRTIRSFPEMPNVTFPIEQLLNRLQDVADNSRGKKKDDFVKLIDTTRSLADSVPHPAPEENLLGLTIEELEDRAQPPKKATQNEKDKTAAIKKIIAAAKKVRNKIKSLERGSGKEQIISACRDRLDDQVVEWIDAALAIDPEEKIYHSPILGTGGNEGRLDYSNGFMKNIKYMLLEDPDASKDLLKNAIFDEPTEHLRCASVGQYDPGRAGGFNQGHDIETKDFPVNPWTYILTMEGTIPWASSITRRQRSTVGSALRSPFTVRATPVGFSSSSEKDQSDARAEIWAPLWERPAGYREIRTLLSEGRADIGRTPASNGIEFAEAAASLGVDRGISEFVRYNLLKRRGDSYIALPAGRFPVHFRTESDLVRELNPLLNRIDYVLRGDEVPARLKSARRSIDKTMYTMLLHGGATHVKHLVAAIGRLEQLIAKTSFNRKPIVKQPLSGLNPRWIAFSDDGCVEVRIAAALASIGSTGNVGPIRANLTPINPKKPSQWDGGMGQVAWEGNSLSARLSSVLARRMMDADRLGVDSNPLRGAIQLSQEDISAIIEGNIDESLVEDLFFGFSWIRWRDIEAVCDVWKELLFDHGWNRPVTPRIVPRSFALLKLLFLPGGVRIDDDPIVIRYEPSIIPLLRSGRINDACTIAGRRLRTTGFIPITTTFPDGRDGVRMAAALLLPVRGEQKLMKLVLKPKVKQP